MSFGKVFRVGANRLLRPLRLELIKAGGGEAAAFTMEDGLARARNRDLNVGTILDIGASDGKWSRLAMHHFPEADVVAFEPLAERREALEQLKKRNPKFDFVLAAAGDQKGFVGFNVAGDLDGSGISDNATQNTRSVPMTTIDIEILDRQLCPPFLLKLDTHGFELPILVGASKTLAETKLVIIEVYNFQLTSKSLLFHEICTYMLSLGFRCGDVVDPLFRVHDQAFWQMDIFFFPTQSPMFQYEGYR